MTFAIAAASFALALSAAPSAAHGAPSPDESEIRGTVESLRAALEQNKPDVLADLFSPDARIVWDGEAFEGPKAFAEAMAKKLKAAPLKWKSEEATGRAEGPLAYVAQRVTVEEGGKAVKRALTFVLRKRSGQWRIVHLHASALR